MEIGKVHFSLFPSPAFSVERSDSGSPGIVIHEDPSIGIEPMAYVETMRVRPSLWSLLSGRFVIASIRLEDDVSINLTKTGQGSEFGRWNFASFVNPSVMYTTPAIHVRNGRIHFKFRGTPSRSSISPKRIWIFLHPLPAEAAGASTARESPRAPIVRTRAWALSL